MSKSSHNLLYQQNILKSDASNKEKILAQAKLEIFGSLDLQGRKPIQIGDIAEKLSKERWNSGWLPNKIEIWWKTVNIDQNNYRSIFDNYSHFLWENNQKWIEWTDRALAQRLILDNGNMIVFENNLEEAQKTFDSLNQDEKYTWLIELLQKKTWNKNISLIKRTDKERNKIQEVIAKKERELDERQKKNKIENNKENKSESNETDWTIDIEYEEIKDENKETKENKEEINKIEKSKSNEILRKELLINRDNLADKIRELRETKWFSKITDKDLEIRSWVFVDLKKDKDTYLKFLENYLRNKWDIKELEKLDTEFAEILILQHPENVPMDQKYCIQINNDESGKDNKSEKELEKEAKRCEKSLIEAGYNVEYIKINQNKSESIFNEDFVEKTKEEVQKLKSKKETAQNWMLTPAELARLVAKQNLLSSGMTLEKLQDLVNKLSDGHELSPVEIQRLIVYKIALENLSKNNWKVYHVVRRKKQLELPPHIDEKEELENSTIEEVTEKKVIPDDDMIIDDEDNKKDDNYPYQKELSPHIDDKKEDSYSFIPPKPIVKTIPKKKERTATISNVESVHLEEANHRAEELAREEYEKLWKLKVFDISTWKTWERMKTYALRSIRRQKRRNSHLAHVKWNIDLTRQDVVFASDRHELESNEADWTGIIDKRLIDHHNPDIDLLCKEFLTTSLLDRDFEKRFNDILRLDPTVMSSIGSNKMDYLASNILLKLKNEKAEYTMVDEISKLLTTGTPYSAATFQTQLNTITGNYFRETKKNYPKYIQEILDNISDPIEIGRIITHQQALLNEDVKTLQMQLQLLDNTTGAYEIDNKDKEKWFWYKLGAWMDRHPYLTLGWSILTGAWVLATGWLIGWVAWAATATGLIATKIGMMTAAKKASHYTKEQKGQEKRLTHGLNIEKKTMDNIKTVMDNAPWYSRRKYKAKRQFNLYQESTQKNIADTTRLTDFINRFVALPGALSPTEEAALRNYLSNGLARVDYYKKTGHNFVASQDKTKVEIDMRNLYTAITQWSEKLGTDLSTIRWTTEYTSLNWDLTTDYDTSMENFKTQRRNLELKYGIWAGVLYAWTAVWLQAILGSGIFGNYPCGTIIWWEQELGLHNEVKNALTNAWATQENITNIENTLRNAPTSPTADWYNQEAWRTIVKNEMWWSESQVNSWMHDFMKDTLWTLNEWWVNEFKQQLLNAKIESLTANTLEAKTAEVFLSSPKIGLINEWEWAKILADLQSWMSGKDITLFTAEEKMKMGYYGHLFIHNDSWIWSRLTEEITKLTSTWWWTIEEICNRHYWLDGIGMPVFANTFMERMNPEKGELWEPIPSPKTDPVPDPTIVITDKDHPATTSWTPTYSWLTGK